MDQSPASANSFDRRLRLTRGSQFKAVFKSPRVSQDRCFRILACCNELDHARLGMAVSTRVCKSAVGRNRLKRLIRESFRHNHKRLVSAGKGLDLVILPSFISAGVSNHALRESLDKHWLVLPHRMNQQTHRAKASMARSKTEV